MEVFATLEVEGWDNVPEGACLLARIVGGRRVLFGVESDKRDAAAALEAATKEAGAAGLDLEVRVVPARYPQGAEKQLVTALTGRVIPPRSLPYAVHVVVQNDSPDWRKVRHWKSDVEHRSSAQGWHKVPSPMQVPKRCVQTLRPSTSVQSA